MQFIGLLLFALLWIFVVYIFNCILTKSFCKIDIKIAILYISTVAFIGLIGETFVGSIYNCLFGLPLWQYQALPIHNGHTSYYAPIIWGVYGFYLYLLHDHLVSKKGYSDNKLMVMFSVEAMVIEALVNISFLLIFGHYLYFYSPNDLWHFTSIQTFPFYFIAGFLITRTIKRFKQDPVFFSFMCIAISIAILIL